MYAEITAMGRSIGQLRAS